MKKVRIKILLIFIILISANSLLNAQFNRPTGARQAAMCFSSSTNTDVWANNHNQAGLAGIESFTVGIFYTNRFSMDQLSTKSLAMAMPVSKYGSFGLNYTSFGYNLYNESKFGLAYAMNLGKKFAVGIQLDYFLIKFGNDYGKTGNLVGEVGILANPVDKLFIAAHVFNPWLAKYADYQDERVPTVFKVGLGYYFSKQVLFTTECEKDIDNSTIFKSGLEYNVVAGLYIRAGISTKPTTYAFGIGYNYKGIIFDFAFSNHQYIGNTSQFGLSYVFKNKSKSKTAF